MARVFHCSHEHEHEYEALFLQGSIGVAKDLTANIHIQPRQLDLNGVNMASGGYVAQMLPRCTVPPCVQQSANRVRHHLSHRPAHQTPQSLRLVLQLNSAEV